MKYILYTLILISSIFTHDKIEETEPTFGWKQEVIANLNFTNSGFQNWAKGGENSSSWQSILRYQFVDDEKTYNWDTNGKFAFGETKVGDNAEFQKTSDEILFETVYTHKLGTHVNPYAALTASTQFSTSYDYKSGTGEKVSAFMDPGTFTESFGIGYSIDNIFKVRTGLSFKQTFTKQHSDAADDLSTPEIEDFKFETGLEIASSLNMMIFENVKLQSKLAVFSAIDAIKRVDVNLDNVFSSKINSFLTVSFSFAILYDYDVSSQRQWKDVLAVGISYALL